MPRKKHDFTATEIKAGVFVLAAAAVFILFTGVVLNYFPVVSGKPFVVYFQDTGGLDEGADVRYGGYKVGRVNSIGLDPANQSRIRVEITVADDVPVNEDSEVLITSVTLTSARHVEIKTGSPDAPRLAAGSVIPAQDGGLFTAVDTIAHRVAGLLEDVQTLVGVEAQQAVDEATGEAGELVTVAMLMTQVEDILEKGGSIAGEIDDVVTVHRKDIESVFEGIEGITGTAQDIVASIDGIIGENRGDIRAAVGNVREATDGLGPIMDDARALSGRIDSLADALQNTLDYATVLSGDAAGLLGDNRPAMDDLVHELSEAVRYLKIFARTLAERPQSLVVGKGN